MSDRCYLNAVKSNPRKIISCLPSGEDRIALILFPSADHVEEHYDDLNILFEEHRTLEKEVDVFIDNSVSIPVIFSYIKMFNILNNSYGLRRVNFLFDLPVKTEIWKAVVDVCLTSPFVNYYVNVLDFLTYKDISEQSFEWLINTFVANLDTERDKGVIVDSLKEIDRYVRMRIIELIGEKDA